MSLEADFRRDINPTPTRFLLECGAFTPGLSLHLENYNPFDASLKFLNTGTPKVEMNPFDTSFKAPPAGISVKTNNIGMSQGLQHELEKQSWADMMFDDVAMPRPPMSPGLSPSSSSLSASPSPSIHSPPLQTVSLNSFGSSMTTFHETTHSHTYNHDLVFERLRSEVGSHAHFANNSAPETLAPCDTLARPLPSLDGYQPDNSEDDDEMADQRDHYVQRDSACDQEPIDQHEDSGMDVAMSALAMRRQSEMSDIVEPEAFQYEPRMKGSNNNETGANKSTRSNKSKKDSAEPASTTTASSRKAKGTTTTRAGTRKRSSTEEESPDVKRQRFLERNRMAASKCREKKRLQTLKTISDADEITARNQALHETLNQLQEEVRQLKNQILCHRDCGCDVIQKFVQTSFGFSTSTSPCSTSSSPSSTSVPPRQPMF
ncbi:hypothetical protein BGX34_008427 [Mortierella sp. NVP85]|nr:hypothetical protein BGX34_008427 [Mortierella sp. NVP85]